MADKKGYIKLKWSKIPTVMTDNSRVEYLIEYSTDGVNYKTLAITPNNEYLHTNLDPDTLYYYRVWTIKDGVKSKKCASISTYAKDTKPPATPTIMGVEPIMNGLRIKFAEPQDPDWDGFEVYLGDNQNFTPSSTNLYAKTKSTIVEISGLQGGQTYWIKARSFDTSGNYSGFTVQSAIPRISDDTTPPATPTNLQLTTGLDTIEGSGSKLSKNPAYIKATWTANSEPDLAGYQLRIKKQGDDGYAIYTVSKNETSYTFKNLTPGVQYEVGIRAYDTSLNYSNWQTTTITTAGDSEPPSAPTISARAYFKTIYISWTKPTANDLAGFILEASQNQNTWDTIYEGLGTSFTYNADVNQTWYFRVKAYDTSGNVSNYSNVVSVSTPYLQDADIQADTIMGDKIKAGTITGDKIQAYAIDSIHIKSNAINSDKIQAGAITSDKIQANSISIQHLTSDVQIFTLSTGFSWDSDQDGIPDGWVAQPNQGTVGITSEDYWLAPSSLKMTCPSTAQYSTWITLDKYLPIFPQDRPLFVWAVAKRTAGDGMLYFTIRQYNANLERIDPDGQGYSRAFNGLNNTWQDYLFQINSGSLAIYPDTRYIQIALGLAKGTQDTTVYVGFLRIVPIGLTPVGLTSLFLMPTSDLLIGTYSVSATSAPIQITNINEGQLALTLGGLITFAKISRITISGNQTHSTTSCTVSVYRIGGREVYGDDYTLGTIQAFNGPPPSPNISITYDLSRSTLHRFLIRFSGNGYTLYSGETLTIGVYGIRWTVVI